jgi:hypothetical protein
MDVICKLESFSNKNIVQGNTPRQFPTDCEGAVPCATVIALRGLPGGDTHLIFIFFPRLLRLIATFRAVSLEDNLLPPPPTKPERYED